MTMEYVVQLMLGDELNEKQLKQFVRIPLFKKSLPGLFANEASLWWDDVKTDGFTESREMIVVQAYKAAIEKLTEQQGGDIKNWKWGNLHTINNNHPLGQQWPLNYLFDVGPAPAPGTLEGINNQGFYYDGDAAMDVFYCPAMRKIIDFSDIEKSVGIIPSGQSGHFMSPHYDDQFELYNTGKYRPINFTEASISANSSKVLELLPN